MARKTASTGLPLPAKRPARLGPRLAPPNPEKAITATVFASFKMARVRASPCWRGLWNGEKTGIMSFMVNQNDEVYQANLGDETQSKSARHFAVFAGFSLAGHQSIEKPGVR